MAGFRRYALYFSPRPGAFVAQRMSTWLGVDTETGGIVCRSEFPDMTGDDVDRITSSPRYYGAHATLKAPFVLRENARENDLFDAVEALAFDLRPISLGQLEIAGIGHFLALVCPVQRADVNTLARRAVIDLDHLCAPLRQSELERRMALGLSKHQEDLLKRWGYPYIFDEYRFHITLTGLLEDGELDKVALTLRDHFTPEASRYVVIKDICVFGDPGDGAPFKLITRFPLGA